MRKILEKIKMFIFENLAVYLANYIANYLTTYLGKYFATFSTILPVKVKKLDPDAKLPTKAYAGDAGWDLYALNRVYIDPCQTVVVKTGLAFEIPEGWHIQVHTRSSFGKKGVRCHLGIVDSGYRNELGIIITNHSLEHFLVEKGDKFAQLIFLPVPIVVMTQTDTLSNSDRGLGGFGSSGR